MQSSKEIHDDHITQLRATAETARQSLADTDRARERALRLSREMIRHCADSIRAIHRGEFETARGLISNAAALVDESGALLQEHPEVYFTGYMQDALKEYVEANAVLAFIQSRPLPTPEDLQVGAAPYLGGLADTVGELRRHILDKLRHDDFDGCERALALMDEIYTILVTMDFPDAVTRGLRRSTDMVRGVLERTRGDLTVALRQQRLEAMLSAADADRVDG
ncbi:MAG: haloacid dehalogenase [Chloroflexota bacterium]|nr:haloacid dehalogenase [Chloroflexota bacterium]